MNRRFSWRRSAAALGATVLALIGVVPAAYADEGPKTTVTAAVSEPTLTLSVKGTDYFDLPGSSIGMPASGVYAALRDGDTMSNAAINADTGIVPAVEYIPNARIIDNAWEATLSVDAANLSPDARYEVIVWVAHGQITESTLVATVPVELSADQRSALFGEPDPDPEPEPEITPEPEPARHASVEVAGANEDGATLAVTGTGFVNLPDSSLGRPAAGVYAALRDAATMDLEYIAANMRSLPAVEYIRPQQIVDGDWSMTLTAPVGALDPDATYEVLIWVAHGIPTDATLLEVLPVTFTPEQLQALFPEAAPETKRSAQLTVEAVTTEGLDIAVSGEGFTDLPAPTSGGPVAGIYAALRDANTMSNETINADTAIVPAVAFIPAARIRDGVWRTALHADAADIDPGGDYEVIVWVAHGDITETTLLETLPVTLTDAQRELLTGSDDDETVPAPSPQPGTQPQPKPTPSEKPTLSDRPSKQPDEGASTPSIVCTTQTVPGTPGTPVLTWGVKSSFVSYIQGGIAKGSVMTSNGAVRSGGTFTWGRGTGTLSASGQGTLRFPGVVSFTGHGGILATTFTNVRVQVNAGGSGVIIADVRSTDMNGKDISTYGAPVANLRFSSVGSSGGSATATLTAAGARALAGFYNAGEAMDGVRISFVGASGPTTQEICHDTDGNRVNPDGTPYVGASGGYGGGLAVTGASQNGLGLVAVSALLFGVLLLGVRRAGLSR